MLDLTKMYNLTAIGIKDASVRMLGTVQKEKPEAVVAAFATLFISICERYHVDVRRVLETTDRILRDARDKHPVEMRAMARYLREELPDA
jgi:hypothetical protein